MKDAANVVVPCCSDQATLDMYGELIPVGGGDTIPLRKKTLLVGRRESCDIVLRFPNVSAHHCQLQIDAGYWYVRDQKSRNGVKVNGTRVTEKRLDPGDMISIATHRYTVQYSPMDLGAVGPPPQAGTPSAEIFSKSLLERAGLSNEKGTDKRRYDVMNNEAGQIKDPTKPI